MLTPEELRDELRTRSQAVLARKAEIQARFTEHADDPVIDSAVGLALVGAGVGTIVFSLVTSKRSVWTYLLAGLFVVLGLSVMGGGALSRRSDRVSEVEDVVREQLGRIDPLARARMLHDMAADAMAPFFHLGRE